METAVGELVFKQEMLVGYIAIVASLYGMITGRAVSEYEYEYERDWQPSPRHEKGQFGSLRRLRACCVHVPLSLRRRPHAHDLPTDDDDDRQYD